MYLKNLSACCGGGAVLSSSVTPGVRSRREDKFERGGGVWSVEIVFGAWLYMYDAFECRNIIQMRQ